MTSAPGWTVSSLQEMRTDRRKFEGITPDATAPEGKKWECCAHCNGSGKVLVDDIPEVKRYSSPLPQPLPRIAHYVGSCDGF